MDITNTNWIYHKLKMNIPNTNWLVVNQNNLFIKYVVHRTIYLTYLI